MKKLELKIDNVLCNSAEAQCGVDHFYLVGALVVDDVISKVTAFESKPINIKADSKYREVTNVIQGYNSAYLKKYKENREGLLFSEEVSDESKIYLYIMAFDEYLQDTWSNAPENCARIAEELKEATDSLNLKGLHVFNGLKPIALESICKATPFDEYNYLKEQYMELNKKRETVIFNFNRETELYKWDYNVEIGVNFE